MQNQQFGLIDNWLRHLKDIIDKHQTELNSLPEAERFDRLCELNVKAQVQNVCYTSIVQGAWRRGHSLMVHGWIYGLTNGHLKDLGVSVQGVNDVDALYHLTP